MATRLGSVERAEVGGSLAEKLNQLGRRRRQEARQLWRSSSPSKLCGNRG